MFNSASVVIDYQVSFALSASNCNDSTKKGRHRKKRPPKSALFQGISIIYPFFPKCVPRRCLILKVDRETIPSQPWGLIYQCFIRVDLCTLGWDRCMCKGQRQKRLEKNWASKVNKLPIFSKGSPSIGRERERGGKGSSSSSSSLLLSVTRVAWQFVQLLSQFSRAIFTATEVSYTFT